MRIFLLVCVVSAACFAQNFPFILGGAVEIGSGMLDDSRYGTGFARITPFAGFWVNGLGFARIGASSGSQKESGSEEDFEIKRLDISAQIGYSAIGPERPYITASYSRNKSYSKNSDAAWNEWGLGIGHRFSLSPFAAIIIEAEHRWVAEHYNREKKSDISGRRLQMNFGLVANPL
jgi:hypothetical protein